MHVKYITQSQTACMNGRRTHVMSKLAKSPVTQSSVTNTFEKEVYVQVITAIRYEN